MGIRKKKDKKKALKHRFAKNEPSDASDDEPIVIFEPRGEVKMSEVLLDFISPYRDTWETEDQFRKLILMAIVAWNAAIAPDDKGAELVQSTMATLPPEAQADYLQIVVSLIERKQRFFASNTRMIINHTITMTPAGPHLQVMSTLPT
jgi:hypothetical protein